MHFLKTWQKIWTWPSPTPPHSGNARMNAFFLRSTTLKVKPKESKTGNKMVTRNSDQSGDHRKAKFKKFVVPWVWPLGIHRWVSASFASSNKHFLQFSPNAWGSGEEVLSGFQKKVYSSKKIKFYVFVPCNKGARNLHFCLQRRYPSNWQLIENPGLLKTLMNNGQYI